MNILELFSQNKSIQTWQSDVTSLKRQLVMGLSGSSKAAAIASAYLSFQGKLVVVSSTQNDMEKLAGDLSALLDEDSIFQLFADDTAAAEFISSSMDKTISRIEALAFLSNPEARGILVISLAGLRILLPSPKTFQQGQ
ncbi:transcription-repair coupling factor, partial [Haloferax sp. Atlit-10N]